MKECDATAIAEDAWLQETRESGFATIPKVIPPPEMSDVLLAIRELRTDNARAGLRNMLQCPAVRQLARDPRLMGIAIKVLGADAFPFRATLFDKSPETNWLVAWHQDRALPIHRKQDRVGWGPWSTKEGVLYAQAPANALEQVIALRLHFDDCLETNGPLRVLPATHRLGVLTGEAIDELASQVSPVSCHIATGGVLVMSPLLLHGSSKSKASGSRRVLHIEYAASRFLDDMEIATA
jgi:hypothetical protein